MMRRTPLRSKSAKPKKRDPSKVPAHTRKETSRGSQKFLDSCRGEPCFLAVQGICPGEAGRETVVPCHSNQGKHGKGMGLKADHKFTVPGCFWCHAWLDQGAAPKAEKDAVFDWALTRWEAARDKKMGIDL